MTSSSIASMAESMISASYNFGVPPSLYLPTEAGPATLRSSRQMLPSSENGNESIKMHIRQSSRSNHRQRSRSSRLSSSQPSSDAKNDSENSQPTVRFTALGMAELMAQLAYLTYSVKQQSSDEIGPRITAEHVGTSNTSRQI